MPPPSIYKVRVLMVKEVEEVIVEAAYCFVDWNNNLVFQDEPLFAGAPLDMFSAKYWVSVEKV